MSEKLHCRTLKSCSTCGDVLPVGSPIYRTGYQYRCESCHRLLGEKRLKDLPYAERKLWKIIQQRSNQIHWTESNLICKIPVSDWIETLEDDDKNQIAWLLVDRVDFHNKSNGVEYQFYLRPRLEELLKKKQP